MAVDVNAMDEQSILGGCGRTLEDGAMLSTECVVHLEYSTLIPKRMRYRVQGVRER